MKKINYVDNDGNELQKVAIYFEINEIGQSIETILLLPKGMTDEETSYGWYYPDEEKESDEV